LPCHDRDVIRPFQPADQAFLWDMLYESIFVAPDEEPPPRSILTDPHLSHYVEAMGSRPGDMAWVVEHDSGARLGAVWLRRLPATDPGYGFVDASTPELGIAVASGRRGRGVGSALLATALAAVGRCSLSVDARNPAMRLYERLGFVVVGGDARNPTMLYTAPTSGQP